MSETSSLRSKVIEAIESLFTPDERKMTDKLLIQECNAEKIYASSEAEVERVKLAVLRCFPEIDFIKA